MTDRLVGATQQDPRLLCSRRLTGRPTDTVTRSLHTGTPATWWRKWLLSLGLVEAEAEMGGEDPWGGHLLGFSMEFYILHIDEHMGCLNI